MHHSCAAAWIRGLSRCALRCLVWRQFPCSIGLPPASPKLLSRGQAGFRGRRRAGARQKIQCPRGCSRVVSRGLRLQTKHLIHRPVPVLNAEAVKFSGWEFFPAVAVAVPVAGRLSNPRKMPVPLTSSFAARAELPMPTWSRCRRLGKVPPCRERRIYSPDWRPP